MSMPSARRKVCAPPAVEPNLNGTSVRIGKIKIDAARMLSDAILTTRSGASNWARASRRSSTDPIAAAPAAAPVAW
jgi:hypothetical protein